MKYKRTILYTICIVSLFVISFGCGKETFNIGRSNPQMEMQKCLKLSEKKKFEEAVECLEIFKSRFPATSFSRQAELSIADNYFEQKEYLLAADTYLIFSRMYPTNSQSDYVYYRLGLSYFKESPKAIDRDQQYLDEAIHYLKIAVSAFPQSPYNEAARKALAEARLRTAKRNFYIGRFYYRTGEYKAAIPRFIEVVNKYPDTDLAPEALYKLIISAGKLKMPDDAKLFFSKLNVDYPQSKWTKKAESKVLKIVEKYGNTSSTPQLPTTGE